MPFTSLRITHASAGARQAASKLPLNPAFWGLAACLLVTIIKPPTTCQALLTRLVDIYSPDPHNNFIKEVLFSGPFSDEETEAQRG